MRRRFLTRSSVLATAVAVVGLIVAACGGGGATATPQPTATPRPPTPTVAAPRATPVPAATATAAPAATATPRPAATPVPTPTPAPTATPTGPVPRRGGILNSRDILDWANWDSYHQFGGFASLVESNMWSNLLHPDLDDETKLVSDLATSWTLAQDGLTWTLKLRPNIKWTDGKAFTAADVQWNLDRGRNPPNPLITFNTRKLSAIGDIQTPDDTTVVIKLKQVSASFIAGLGSFSMLMYPPHVDNPGNKQTVVGTGPFKFSRHEANNVLEMVRNENYHQKDAAGRALPYLDGLRVFVIGDPKLAKSALLAGRIDCGCEFDHDYATEANPELKSKGFKTFLRLADEFNLIFNFTKPPFDNAKARQAFSMMLDRRALVLLPRGGFGEFPPNFMLPTNRGGQWGLPEDEILKFPGFRAPFSSEVSQAKQLLKDAGIDLGKLNLLFQAVVSPNVDPYHLAAHNLLLNASGANITLKQSRGAAYNTDFASKAWDIFMTAGGTSFDDPDALFLEFITSNGARNAPKLDYGIDPLAVQQNATLDFKKRQEVVREIQRKLMNDFTHVPAVWQVDGYATSADVEGYVPPPLSVGPQFRLERLWFNK